MFSINKINEVKFNDDDNDDYGDVAVGNAVSIAGKLVADNRQPFDLNLIKIINMN